MRGGHGHPYYMPVARKLTRFYIINPVGDRRTEIRFDSHQDVALKIMDTNKVGPAVAMEIGEHGLKLETPLEISQGDEIEIAFPNAADGIKCFGRVAWVKYMPAIKSWVGGISADSWHGIVAGSKSWTTYKGRDPKKDRRHGSR